MAADLKRLREERQEYVSRAKASIKKHNKNIKAISAALAGDNDGKTIPELATAIGMPTESVLVYVSTMKKYGQIAEGAKDGDYFRYKLLPKK